MRFFIHANLSFNAVENPYFLEFLNALRPMYKAPSRFVLSTSILDAEASRVMLKNMEDLKDRKFLTLLVDGWEDVAGRSLYGTVVAEPGKQPVVLGLTDLTGKRATADAIVDVCNENRQKMGIEPRQIAALCTDNPSTMISARRKWETMYPWVIVSTV